MQRRIVGSAWEIQASRPVVGRSRIVVSGRDKIGRSSARRVQGECKVLPGFYGNKR
jgi:hypothetical protein